MTILLYFNRNRSLITKYFKITTKVEYKCFNVVVTGLNDVVGILKLFEFKNFAKSLWANDANSALFVLNVSLFDHETKKSTFSALFFFSSDSFYFIPKVINILEYFNIFLLYFIITFRQAKVGKFYLLHFRDGKYEIIVLFWHCLELKGTVTLLRYIWYSKGVSSSISVQFRKLPTLKQNNDKKSLTTENKVK